MSKVYLKRIDEIKNNKTLSLNAWKLLNEISMQEYGIDTSTLKLSTNENGKPFWLDGPFCFNISHSKNMIAIIVSKEEVGIDIQYVKELPNAKELAKKINSKSDSNIDVIKRFSELEAYYKKIGSGIWPNKLKDNIVIKKQIEITSNNDQYILSIDCNDEIDSITWKD